MDEKRKWTHEETILYLFRAVEQLEAGGKKLSASGVKMPGRTPKACTHQWDKIKKDVARYLAANGNGAGNGNGSANGDDVVVPGTPVTPVTPKRRAAVNSRKRTAKTIEEEDSEEGDGEGPFNTPSTSRRGPPRKKTKLIKDEDDADEEAKFKNEPVDDAAAAGTKVKAEEDEDYEETVEGEA